MNRELRMQLDITDAIEEGDGVFCAPDNSDELIRVSSARAVPASDRLRLQVQNYDSGEWFYTASFIVEHWRETPFYVDEKCCSGGVPF